MLSSFNEQLNFIDENYDQKQYLLIVRYQLRYIVRQMEQLNDLRHSQKQVLTKCRHQIEIVSAIIKAHDILDIAE